MQFEGHENEGFIRYGKKTLTKLLTQNLSIYTFFKGRDEDKTLVIDIMFEILTDLEFYLTDDILSARNRIKEMIETQIGREVTDEEYAKVYVLSLHGLFRILATDPHQLKNGQDLFTVWLIPYGQDRLNWKTTLLGDPQLESDMTATKISLFWAMNRILLSGNIVDLQALVEYTEEKTFHSFSELLKLCTRIQSSDTSYPAIDRDVVVMRNVILQNIHKVTIESFRNTRVEFIVDFLRYFAAFLVMLKYLKVDSTQIVANMNNILTEYLEEIDRAAVGQVEIVSLQSLIKEVRKLYGHANRFNYVPGQYKKSNAINETKKVTQEAPQTNYEFVGYAGIGTNEYTDAMSTEFSLSERCRRKLRDSLELRTSPRYLETTMSWDALNLTYPYEKGSRYSKGGTIRAKKIAGYEEVAYDTGYEFYHLEQDIYLVSEYDFSDQVIRFSVSRLNIDEDNTVKGTVEVIDNESVDDLESIGNEILLLTGEYVVPFDEESAATFADILGEYITTFVLGDKDGYYRGQLLECQSIISRIKSDRFIFRRLQEYIKRYLANEISRRSENTQGIFFGQTIDSRPGNIIQFWNKYGNVVSRKYLEYMLEIKDASTESFDAFTHEAHLIIDAEYPNVDVVAGWKSWVDRRNYRCQLLTLETGEVVMILTAFDKLTHH